MMNSVFAHLKQLVFGKNKNLSRSARFKIIPRTQVDREILEKGSDFTWPDSIVLDLPFGSLEEVESVIDQLLTYKHCMEQTKLRENEVFCLHFYVKPEHPAVNDGTKLKRTPSLLIENPLFDPVRIQKSE